MCVWYTEHRKLSLLAMAKRVQDEEGLPLQGAAEHLQVIVPLLWKWMMQKNSKGNPTILAMLKSKMKAACAGPLGQIKPIESKLLI
jgi:hypothetical protein